MNKKQQIIESSIAIMGREGLGCSMKLITKDAGCSETLIYKYFDTREKLTAACFNSICHDIREALKDVEKPDSMDRSRIIEYFRGSWIAYCSFIDDNPDKGRFYIQYSWSKNPFPSRYKTPDRIVQKILGNTYGNILEYDKKMICLAEYIVCIANVFMMGKMKGWS